MRIFIAGDSTFQYNDASSYPQTGIGQILDRFFNTSEKDEMEAGSAIEKKVQIINCARNGRSTKSFISEGRLEQIDKMILPGDFLFVVFGHNDEKMNDPARGTEPYGELQTNLDLFAKVAEKHGAFPVFFTPIARRSFEVVENGSEAKETHGEYPKAIIHYANKNDYPVIDLSTLTREYLTKVGEEKSRAFYMNFDAGIYESSPDGKADNTHLRADGAMTYGKILASEVAKLEKNWTGKNADAYKKLAKAVCGL